MVYDSVFNASEILLTTGDVGGPCSGDSGGPAVIEKNNKYYILGVASRADVSCKSEVIYGDVSSQSVSAWIKKNSALLQGNSAR
jgi:secreted trypsin-like serine protease